MRRFLRFVLGFLVLSPLVFVYAQPPGQGSATLTWTPASTYTNGSAMTLAAQNIYMTTVQGACVTSILQPNAGPACQLRATVGAGISSYVVDGLFNGTWYFTADSVDDIGNTSFSSNEASKLINIVGNLPPGVRPNPPGNLAAQ